jgi:hypothetical protein
MSLAWVILAGFGVLWLMRGVVSVMFQEEARTRLEHLPNTLIRLAAMRLPKEMRDDIAAEWRAELASVLRDTDGLPLTRLLRGVLYASGMFRAAGVIAHELSEKQTAVSAGIHVIDLERINHLPRTTVGPVARYVATLQAQRGDYNGKIIPLRIEHLRSLAVIYDKSVEDLIEDMNSWGVLNGDMDVRTMASIYGKSPADLTKDLVSWGFIDDAEQHAAPLSTKPALKMAINVERMKQLPKERVGPLAHYVATVQALRDDYNGKVFVVDSEEMRALVVIYDMSPADFTKNLIFWGLVDDADLDLDWDL